MSSGRVGQAFVLTCFFTAGYGRHRKLEVAFRTAGYGRHRSQWVKMASWHFKRHDGLAVSAALFCVLRQRITNAFPDLSDG